MGLSKEGVIPQRVDTRVDTQNGSLCEGYNHSFGRFTKKLAFKTPDSIYETSPKGCLVVSVIPR